MEDFLRRRCLSMGNITRPSRPMDRWTWCCGCHNDRQANRKPIKIAYLHSSKRRWAGRVQKLTYCCYWTSNKLSRVIATAKANNAEWRRPTRGSWAAVPHQLILYAECGRRGMRVACICVPCTTRSRVL